MGVGMSDYKELVEKLRCPNFAQKARDDAADAIEQLCTDVARLEAENRAKEQYIAETIGKVIKERGRLNMKMPDYLRVKVIPSTMQIIVEAVTEELVPVVHGKWLETDSAPHHVCCSQCYKTFVKSKNWLKSNGGSVDDAEYCPHCGAKMGEVSE